MSKKKLKIYGVILAALLLAFTFSAVRKEHLAHSLAKPDNEALLPKSELDFLQAPDTRLSDVRIEKIQPLLKGERPANSSSWGRDPFWPAAHVTSRTPVFLRKSRKQKPAFRLEGIISRGRVKKAIINGKVVRVGNRVGSSFRVKIITDNMVVLIGPQREIYLHF